MGIKHIVGHADEVEPGEVGDEIGAPDHLRQENAHGGHAGEHGCDIYLFQKAQMVLMIKIK